MRELDATAQKVGHVSLNIFQDTVNCGKLDLAVVDFHVAAQLPIDIVTETRPEEKRYRSMTVPRNTDIKISKSRQPHSKSVVLELWRDSIWKLSARITWTNVSILDANVGG